MRILLAEDEKKVAAHVRAGLTNTVVTNDTLNGSAWGVLTNIPPPPDTNAITITDPISGPTRFYRVTFVP